MRKHQS